MQLGELQHQIDRFERRSANIIALSVDKPKDSTSLVKRLGLTYFVGSDSEQNVINTYRVQNPDTNELAIHAVYILDSAGKVFYRKVSRRRPVSNELIDAIDAYAGNYPQNDPAKPRQRVAVAYPTNNFQAILEASSATELPVGIDKAEYARVEALAMQLHSDDALIALRKFMENNAHVGEVDLLRTVNWLTRSIYFPEDNPNREAALSAGRALAERISRVSTLERELAEADNDDERDKVLQDLAKARGSLTRTRAIIEENAGEWRLRLLKTSIRSYREVAFAALRNYGDAIPKARPSGE